MNRLAVPARSEHSDRAYAVLGRAMSAAVSFELDCRLLWFRLKLGDPHFLLEDLKVFERFIADINEKLGKMHKYIVDRVSLPKTTQPDTIKDVLREAREARNWLVHEGAEDFESKFATTDAWDEWSSTLRERLFQIAEGKQVVAFLTVCVTSEAMPTRATLAQYPDRIIAWVMSE